MSAEQDLDHQADRIIFSVDSSQPSHPPPALLVIDHRGKGEGYAWVQQHEILLTKAEVQIQ